MHLLLINKISRGINLKNTTSFTNWFFLILLVIIWGASFVAIKIAIVDIGPAWLAAARLAIATLLMFIYAKIVNIRPPRGAYEWRIALIFGIVGTTLPFALIGWASLFVPSGIAGLMMATNPMLVLILAIVLLPEEPPTWSRIMGFIIGFIGVALVIMGRTIDTQDSHIPQQLDFSLIAYGALLLAALGYAINNVVSRRAKSIPHATRGYGALLTATPAAIILAVLSEDFPNIMNFHIETTAAILYLAILPTWIATLLLYQLIAQTSSSFVALSNYLVPATAIILGALMLGEQLTILQYLGFGAILVGIGISQGIIRRNNKPEM